MRLLDRLGCLVFFVRVHCRYESSSRWLRLGAITWYDCLIDVEVFGGLRNSSIFDMILVNGRGLVLVAITYTWSILRCFVFNFFGINNKLVYYSDGVLCSRKQTILTRISWNTIVYEKALLRRRFEWLLESMWRCFVYFVKSRIRYDNSRWLRLGAWCLIRLLDRCGGVWWFTQ